MLTRTFIFIGLATLASGCDNTASRLDGEAKVCNKALKIGELELAEETCQRALGNVADDVLAPQVRSERLYRLGSIKRQLSKYDEAADLLNQSLVLETTLTGPDSPQVAGRRLEITLVLAGQNKWQDGAHLLETIVPIANHLTEKEQDALVNVLKHYAVQLQRSEHTEQALRLQAAAESLKRESTSPQ